MERAADVEPPPELVNRILFDAPWSREKSQSKAREWMRAILSPILQPRFAMGIALTMLSLSIIAQGKHAPACRLPICSPPLSGGRWISGSTYTWGRTVKFYNNLKFVYQIQTMLHEWQQQNEDQPANGSERF